MRYLSVCSGIEAASVAWHPLGWTPVAFSEIDSFPCAVLKHHYPHVPNYGDMTKFKEWPDATIDLLVGGTPCQSFSVAGLRKGLDDPRGNLMLTYLAIAERYRPTWVVWENVPGVLSSLTHAAPDPCPPPLPLDLECDGQEVDIDDEYDSSELHALECFLAGLSELGFGYAYRVFDAQYFGVPQRRRRPFVVGCIGDWRYPAAVLLERHCLSGNPPPSRQARENIAPTISARTKGGGGLGTDAELDGALISQTLLAKGNDSCDPTMQTYVAHSLRAEGFDASEDGTGRGTPLVPVAFDTTQITHSENRSDPQPGDPCHPLSASAHPPAIAFDCKSSGQNGFGVGAVAPTLRAMSARLGNQNAGGQVAVAFDLRGREGGAQLEGPHDTANLRAASGGSSRSYIAATAVRRLTPRECERLQGFPDDYTLINYHGKPAADGPRYKALGNSKAVPVVRWIGQRIDAVAALRKAVA